jgi:hypothetical protein
VVFGGKFMGSSKFFLPMLIFSVGCTSAITNQKTTLSTPEGSTLESHEIKTEQTSDITVGTIEEILKKDSKTFGIENLKEKGNSSDFEIRIWSDQETLLHCLLISNKDGKWKASMLTGDLMLNRRTGYQYLKKTKSLKNLSPKSGWKEVSDVLFSKGVRFPFSYKIDEVNKPPAPDEGLVKLELRSEKQYGLAFYQKFSDSDDAKKAIELCRWLQDEFGTDLGC